MRAAQGGHPKDRLAFAFLAKGEPNAADIQPFQGSASLLQAPRSKTLRQVQASVTESPPSTRMVCPVT